MVRMFSQRSVAQELSAELKTHLISKFSLDPPMVDKMRFSGKKGRYSNRPVEYFRICDPSLIEVGQSATPSYELLERTSGNNDALLFEGRLEADKQVYFTDQRNPKVLFP